MEDFYYAGGLRALLAQLVEAALTPHCRTVNGKSLGENIAGARIFNPEVIRTLRRSGRPSGWNGSPVRQPGAKWCGDQADGGNSGAAESHRDGPLSSMTTMIWRHELTRIRFRSTPARCWFSAMLDRWRARNAGVGDAADSTQAAARGSA
jgi:hypothetical protein